jgi:hypothetical protein
MLPPGQWDGIHKGLKPFQSMLSIQKQTAALQPKHPKLCLINCRRRDLLQLMQGLYSMLDGGNRSQGSQVFKPPFQTKRREGLPWLLHKERIAPQGGVGAPGAQHNG